MLNDLYTINEFKGKHFWLSNMSPCGVFVVNSIPFYAVENYYQASKTTAVGRQLQISKLNPFDSKQWGKALTLRDDWEKTDANGQITKDAVMLKGLEMKFAQPKFFNLLVNTGEGELIHGNHHGDVYWGTCLKTGKGHNKLGEMIMGIRTRAFEYMEELEYRIDNFGAIESYLGQFDFKQMDVIAIKFLINEFAKQFDDKSLELIHNAIGDLDIDLDEILHNIKQSKEYPTLFQYSQAAKNVIDFTSKFQDYLIKSNYEIQVK